MTHSFPSFKIDHSGLKPNLYILLLLFSFQIILAILTSF